MTPMKVQKRPKITRVSNILKKLWINAYALEGISALADYSHLLVLFPRAFPQLRRQRKRPPAGRARRISTAEAALKEQQPFYS